MVEKEDRFTAPKEEESKGFLIEPARGDGVLPPGLRQREDESEYKEEYREKFGEEEGEAEVGKRIPGGKIPLQPAVIRLAFRVPGELLAWRTGWDGWLLSEDDLRDIVEVYEALGIEMDPRIQAIILPAVCYGERAVGYTMWRKAGRPGDKRKEWVGGSPPPERSLPIEPKPKE